MPYTDFPIRFPLLSALLDTFVDGNDAGEGTDARDYRLPLDVLLDLPKIELVLGALLPGERDTLVLGVRDPRPGSLETTEEELMLAFPTLREFIDTLLNVAEDLGASTPLPPLE